MPTIRNLRASQVRILPIDEIPYAEISLKDHAQGIGEMFGLTRQVEPLLDVGNRLTFSNALLIYKNGQYTHDGKSYAIENLTIEDRRVLTNIVGPTEICDRIWDELRKFLLKVDTRSDKPEYKPIIVTNDTNCVAQMSFSIKDMIAGSKLETAVERITQSQDNYGAKLDVYPSSFRFRVSYAEPPIEVTQRNISIVDREVIFEVRARSSVNDRVFFTTSPSCSAKHLRLLEEIEKLFA